MRRTRIGLAAAALIGTALPMSQDVVGWPAPKQVFDSPQAIKDGFKEYP